MEILSTGEKIKRARIYQGVTLKELCGDKISISKMSCIENGKIKADEDILKYIADKLNINYSYLIEDVEEQIIKNIELLNDKALKSEETDKIINYNLEYAMEYSYYNLAFELIHKLFIFYMEKNQLENMQLIISQYYDLYQKNNSVENTMTYFQDMATFFMKIKEYNEAINYYSRIREILEETDIANKVVYAYSCFNESVSYMKINEINEAYSIMTKAIKYVDYAKNNEDKGEFYHIYANLNILLHKVETEKYLNKAYEYQKDDKMALAKSKGENGKCYYKIGDKVKGRDEIIEGIKILPKEDKKEYAEFLIKCINTLFNYEEFDLGSELIDEALNISIAIDDVKLIERSYYFKGMILQKMDRYREAEMYMNLSTDALLRFASKEERYVRYNEMADLYYNLKELKESIKYFTLAMNLEKKL